MVLDQYGLADQSMAQHGQAGSWMTGRATPTPWFDEEPEEVAKVGPVAAGGVDAVGWRTDSLVDFQA